MLQVLKRLKQTFGPIYNENNVMISGTHTHSTPGGYLMDIIFDLNTFGFVRETFEAYAEGITRVRDFLQCFYRFGTIPLKT